LSEIHIFKILNQLIMKGLILFTIFSFYLIQTFGAKTPFSASLDNVQVIISDGTDPRDLEDGHKTTPAYPKSDAKVVAENNQHITINFKVKNDKEGTYYQPHQAFAIVTAGNEETILPATHDGNRYTISSAVEEITSAIYSKSGEYVIELVIGDAFITNSIHWKIGSLSLKTKSAQPERVSEDPFAPKPEIVHHFRRAEKRPPKAISSAFTLAVLSPFLFLFIGWIRVGANLRNFPGGSGFIWAIGFQGCLAALIFLFFLYWTALNMMQTLFYMGALSIPTVFFAQRNLNYLSTQNKVKTA